jgi:hypothetical protein
LYCGFGFGVRGISFLVSDWKKGASSKQHAIKENKNQELPSCFAPSCEVNTTQQTTVLPSLQTFTITIFSEGIVTAR